MNEFVKTSFTILPIESLVEILTKLDPKDIFQMCEVEKVFGDMCADQRLFRMLMRNQFPSFPLNKDVKKQYMSIANDVVTNFSANVLYENNEDVQCGQVDTASFARSNTNDYNQISLDIMGYVDPGTNVWIYTKIILHEAEWNSYAFAAKNDAIRACYKDYTEEFLMNIDYKDFSSEEELLEYTPLDYQTFAKEVVKQNSCVYAYYIFDDEMGEAIGEDYVLSAQYSVQFVSLP